MRKPRSIVFYAWLGLAADLLLVLGVVVFVLAGAAFQRSAITVLTQRAQHMELVLEGILSIQAGSNPRVIEQKLLSFLPDKERAALEAERAA